MRKNREHQFLGRHIVVDPEICHGEPTFRGTRVFVSDVLDMVAEGMAWETIIKQWHGSIVTEPSRNQEQQISHGTKGN